MFQKRLWIKTENSYKNWYFWDVFLVDSWVLFVFLCCFLVENRERQRKNASSESLELKCYGLGWVFLCWNREKEISSVLDLKERETERISDQKEERIAGRSRIFLFKWQKGKIGDSIRKYIYTR